MSGRKYKIDLTGNRYGRILVVKEAGRNKHGGIMWECLCDCGNEKIICGDNLKAGTTNSCGCINKEGTRERNFVHGHNKRGAASPEYIAWCNLISRCYNHNDYRYSTYGARGISVCNRWRLSFELFLKDVGFKPAKKYSIERNNVDGNYEPSNCRWATQYEQDRNKTNNRWIEYNGVTMILQDWAKEFNANQGNISKMLKTKSFEQVYDYYKNKRRKLRKNLS